MSIEQGYLVITRVDGSYAAIPMSFVFIFVAVLLIGILVSILVSAIESAERARRGSYIAQLPAEIAAPQPVDVYAEQAARARALKEKLDADTELAESYIKTMRAKGELEEVPEILQHDHAKRLARGR